MKRSIFFGAIICALLTMFASCSSPAGGPEPTYIGTKKPSDAKEVGDIVFNDGSATPYTSELQLTPEQKAAAIAVIFYKGTGLNSDVNGAADTTTSRTLGVGLKLNNNENETQWCLGISASVNTKIETIICSAKGGNGVYTFTGDKNGSDNLEQIAKFLGNRDYTSTLINYPAFNFAKDYSTPATNGTAYDKNGWYLPTIAEVFAIWKVKDSVNLAIELCGGDKFEDKWYWSSSQYDSQSQSEVDKKSCTIYFRDGTCYFATKDDFKCVCAVREFN